MRGLSAGRTFARAGSKFDRSSVSDTRLLWHGRGVVLHDTATFRCAIRRYATVVRLHVYAHSSMYEPRAHKRKHRSEPSVRGSARVRPHMYVRTDARSLTQAVSHHGHVPEPDEIVECQWKLAEKFMDRHLEERVMRIFVQKSNRGDGELLPAVPTIQPMMTENASGGNVQAIITVEKLSHSMYITDVPQNGVLPFYADCTLPDEVIVALNSLEKGYDEWYSRIATGWTNAGSGKLGKFGYAGGKDNPAAGMRKQRADVLKAAAASISLNLKERSEFIRAGKAKQWTAYPQPRTFEGITDLLGTQFSGAASKFGGKLTSYTFSASVTTDAPDVAHFVAEFTAIIDRHASQGFRIKTRAEFYNI